MSGYLEVIFTEPIEPEFRGAFDAASNFWNRVITDSPVQPLNFPNGFNAQGDCGVSYRFPSGSSIDGLAILSSVAGIDGVGSVLGRAGPCIFDGDVPRLGIMEFDSADVQNLVNQGNWEGVIRHEMAHVIGIGTVWTRSGFLNNPCGPFSFFGCDPTYNRPEGIEGYRDLGGRGALEVANTGGQGTQNGHWRESTFDNELMTGFLNSGVENPLSIMTVKALRDIGYTVDVSTAEEYEIPDSTAARSSTIGVDLSGDMIDITPVDIRDVMKRLEAEQNGGVNRTEISSISVAVIALVAAAIAMIIAAVAFKKRAKVATAVQKSEADVSDLA